MDATALFSLSYGMYVVSSKDDTRDVGCMANSVIQVSSSPATLAISLNKNNYTTTCVQHSGRFALSVLSENVEGGVIGTFGFRSSRDNNKFESIAHNFSKTGLAILSKGVCSYIECKIIEKVDCGTHIMFLSEITDAGKMSDEHPMTYEYYHKVHKGKAPKNAPTYVDETTTESSKKYVCDVCGYVFPGTPAEFEALPGSYVCPVCTAPKSCFILK